MKKTDVRTWHRKGCGFVDSFSRSSENIEDYLEGRNAFWEKRKPGFRG
jgi:hypothetical protein